MRTIEEVFNNTVIPGLYELSDEIDAEKGADGYLAVISKENPFNDPRRPITHSITMALLRNSVELRKICIFNPGDLNILLCKYVGPMGDSQQIDPLTVEREQVRDMVRKMFFGDEVNSD